MPCSPEDGPWIALGPPAALETLVPLRDEHARRGEAKLIEGGPADIGRIARSLAGERASVLVVGEAAARAEFASPFCESGDADALLGWLSLDRSELADYVDRAAAILRRRSEAKRAMVLLAPREDRYLALLDEVERDTAATGAIELLRWSAERIRRAPLAAALRIGASVILYAGHGNATGWFGYGGVTAEHLAAGGRWQHDQSAALLFSLSCATGAATAGAARTSRGLADELVALGVAGVALAPLGDTPHENTRLLARRLIDAAGRGGSFPEILRSARASGASLDGYAVIGDPALCAASAKDAAARGACVFAPASDAEDLAVLRQACDQAAAAFSSGRTSTK